VAAIGEREGRGHADDPPAHDHNPVAILVHSASVPDPKNRGSGKQNQCQSVLESPAGGGV